MVFTRRPRIYPGRIDTRMSQYIREVHDIFMLFIIRSGKQMAEIVRKYLFRIYPGAVAQMLHLFPDIAPIERFSRGAYKYRTTFDPTLSAETAQSLP